MDITLKQWEGVRFADEGVSGGGPRGGTDDGDGGRIIAITYAQESRRTGGLIPWVGMGSGDLCGRGRVVDDSGGAGDSVGVDHLVKAIE